MGVGGREKESSGVNGLFQKIRRHHFFFFLTKRQKETRPVLKIRQDKAGVFSTVGPDLDKVDFPFNLCFPKGKICSVFSVGVVYRLPASRSVTTGRELMGKLQADP